MKNYFKFLIRSKVLIKIKGNNIDRFIKRLKNNDIDIINIDSISNIEANIIIYEKDLNKLNKIKTIYNFEIIKYYGWIKLKNNILNNKIIIVFILIFTIFLYIVSNIIFDIEIYTNDYNMKEQLINDLKENGIKKYNFKKNYKEIQIIKAKILNKHRDKIDWIEIEQQGTKYLVKYEPRIINKKAEKLSTRNIVAKKNAIITNINVSSGQIIKSVNSYVKAGDVIVSGYIKLNEDIKDTVVSKGLIFGETWYKINITYPLTYYENYETGNSKKIFVINFLNNEYELLNFNKYKTKNKKNNILLKNTLLPINISLQSQKETKIIYENNNKNNAIKKAIEYSKKKMNEKLKENEYIKNYKILSLSQNNDSISLCLFFTVIEDITEYVNIDSNYDKVQE